MARVLYAWELGGGLGHVMKALPLLRRYLSEGHGVAVAARDVEAAHAILDDLGEVVLQAPRLRPPAPLYGHRPVSYAEVLLQLGFGDGERLLEVVKRWLSLYEQVRPDLVLLDFAPGALLAASIAGLRHCSVGHGFFLPPQEVPMPAFEPGADARRVRRSEQLLLASLNAVRARYGWRAVASLAEFLRSDIDFLTTWPELEHYPTRCGHAYSGPILADESAEPVAWPAGSGPRVAVYLRGAESRTIDVASAVSSLGGIATVYAPGIARHLGTLQSHLAGVHWAPGPYDMRAACAQADAVVCNGGFGTVWTAILAGVPVLCLPSHREQAILSERVVEREVGLIGPTRSGNAFDLRSMLLELLENDRYRSACARVAAKYRDAKDTVAEIVRASLGPSRGVAG